MCLRVLPPPHSLELFSTVIIATIKILTVHYPQSWARCYYSNYFCYLVNRPFKVHSVPLRSLQLIKFHPENCHLSESLQCNVTIKLQSKPGPLVSQLFCSEDAKLALLSAALSLSLLSSMGKLHSAGF